MSKTSIEYVGRRIQIVERDEGAEVTIDGQAVEVLRDSDSGRFYTPELPFQTYGTAEELAKSVAESVAESRG